MYIVGMVIPVAESQKDAYRAWSERAAALLIEYGCLEVVEAWEDNVPEGQRTDFRKAVAAGPGDKIVFCWQKWPDKAHVDAVERAMAEDRRFDPPGEIPFDQRRLIIGCFAPIVAATSAER